VDFEDIYYGAGYNESSFLFSFLSAWNILITSSSNGSESMVIAKPPGSEVCNITLWVCVFLLYVVFRLYGRSGILQTRDVLSCHWMEQMTRFHVECV